MSNYFQDSSLQGLLVTVVMAQRLTGAGKTWSEYFPAFQCTKSVKIKILISLHKWKNTLPDCFFTYLDPKTCKKNFSKFLSPPNLVTCILVGMAKASSNFFGLVNLQIIRTDYLIDQSLILKIPIYQPWYELWCDKIWNSRKFFRGLKKSVLVISIAEYCL